MAYIPEKISYIYMWNEKKIIDNKNYIWLNRESRFQEIEIDETEPSPLYGILTEKNPWEGVDNKYPIGSNVFVEIRNLTNYGAFVELEPGVDGLIHISDLSWIKKVSHPSEVLKKGDKVEAVVLSVDKESKKITLGVKQLSRNPWETIEKTMPVGTIVKGIVTKITAFGAFIELDNGIEGLVHVTELSDEAFGKVEDIVAVGEEVTAKVIKLDPEHKKISLSIKDYLVDRNKINRDDIVVEDKEDSEDEDSKKRAAKKKK
jgi:small subunit ribosomal protein S1